MRCEADYCRKFFHASCALKAGWLYEFSGHEKTAEPYFGLCEKHGDRMQARQKASMYLRACSLASQFARSHSLQLSPTISLSSAPPSSSSLQGELDEAAFRSCWERKRSDYVLFRQHCLEQHPDILETCSKHADQLLRHITCRPHTKDLRAVGGVVVPSFSPAYIEHYQSVTAQLRQLLQSLPAQQEELATVMAEKDRLEQMEEHRRAVAMQGARQCRQWALQYREIVRALARLGARISEPPWVAHHLRMDEQAQATVSNNSCSVCLKSTRPPGSHVTCSQCRKPTHLACLDPPLTAAPKLPVGYGWLCADCDSPTAVRVVRKKSVPAEAHEEEATDRPKRQRTQARQLIKEIE